MGSKAPIRPPRLVRGSRVALVAPAGPLLERDDLTRAEALCRALGYEPRAGPATRPSATATSRAPTSSVWPISTARCGDPDVDAIWCIRGGYGVTRILDQVDFDALARRPRPLIGYSDITALLNAALAPCRRGHLPRSRWPGWRCRPSPAGTSSACWPRPSLPGGSAACRRRPMCCCRRRTGSWRCAAAWRKDRCSGVT